MVSRARSLRFGGALVGLVVATSVAGCGGTHGPRVTCYKAVGNSYRCRQDQGPHGLTPRYATYRVTYDGVNVTYWTKSPNAQTG